MIGFDYSVLSKTLRTFVLKGITQGADIVLPLLFKYIQGIGG